MFQSAEAREGEREGGGGGDSMGELEQFSHESHFPHCPECDESVILHAKPLTLSAATGGWISEWLQMNLGVSGVAGKLSFKHKASSWLFIVLRKKMWMGIQAVIHTHQ